MPRIVARGSAAVSLAMIKVSWRWTIGSCCWTLETTARYGRCLGKAEEEPVAELTTTTLPDSAWVPIHAATGFQTGS